MEIKIDIYREETQYIVVLTENKKSYVYYFRYYVSVEEFVSGLMNSYTYTHYHIKIA